MDKRITRMQGIVMDTLTEGEVTDCLKTLGSELVDAHDDNCYLLAAEFVDRHFTYDVSLTPDELAESMITFCEEEKEKEIQKLREEELRRIDDNVYEERRVIDDYFAEEERTLERERQEIDDSMRKDIQFDESEEDKQYVDNLMKRLYEQPFQTKVIFAEFNEESNRIEVMNKAQQALLMPRIEQWFKDKILTQPVTKKLWYRFQINGQWRTRTLHDVQTRELFYSLLSGSRVFNLDDYMGQSDFYKQFELPPLQLVDAFMITTEDKEAMRKYRKKNKRKEVNDTHESGFFEYALKDEYIALERLTAQLQIFHQLIDPETKKLRKELKYPCLVHALADVIDDKDVLKKICNRIATDYLDIKHLRPIFEEFSIRGTVRYLRDDNQKLRKATTKDGNFIGPEDAKYKIDLVSFRNHYFVYKTLPLNLFYIRHFQEVNEYADKFGKPFEWRYKVDRIRDGVPSINAKAAHCTTYDFVKCLFEVDAFTPYSYYDFDVMMSGMQHKILEGRDPEDLTYDEMSCTRLIAPKKIPESEKTPTYWYADFETCPDIDVHKPFLLCLSSRDGSIKKSFFGGRCDYLFMEYIPDNSVVYFHNLGFDGRFLRKFGVESSIDKGTKIMKQVHNWQGKKVIMKDSYSLLTQPLERFPSSFPTAFKGTNIKKELFPYKYYSYDRVLKYQDMQPIGVISEVGKEDRWSKSQKEQFIQNVDTIPGCRVDDDHFNMRVYAEFYCEQDVNVLRVGFNEFRNSTLQDPINLDVDDYVSAASLANDYMKRNVFYPNGHLYEVSGVVLDFLMKAVYGGRCMTRANKRWYVNKIIDDFDACSLYPSAMRRLWTVEGRPVVLSKHLIDDNVYDKDHPHMILRKLFADDQIERTKDRYISAFVVDIEIVNIGIKREFPLIVKRDKKTGTNANVNECVVMRVDNILLEDLVRFQDISYKVLRGYYWTGKRDHRIRDAIKNLFDLRAEKKREGSPLQETLKLIMNSSYGKSMQKPITKDMKYIQRSKLEAYRSAHYYNYIEDIDIEGSAKSIVILRRKLLNQFNNCLFGIQVLSMSKRIMNEVMCLAEDLHLDIYYQDTDSMHIVRDQVPILAKEFEKLYGRPLIGENVMGCFHGDFDELKNNPTSIESYFLGKKTYIDLLRNDKGEHSFHIRMKGVPIKTIQHVVREEYHNDPMALYALMYHGDEIPFDLCKGRVQFTFTKGGTVTNETTFIRRVKATAKVN